MIRAEMIVVAGLLLASAAWAQNVEVITTRQGIYKGFNEATKPLGAMLKGSADFDLAAVKKALTTYVEGTKKLPDLFPDDSKTSHDTEALPAIWANKADFNARFSKLGADATAALASITDKASFVATMPKVLENCGGCHKTYREKK